jgi:hypothetical protein
LSRVRISKEERIDGLPLLLNELANALKTGQTQIRPESLSAAAIHGANRARQGYTIPSLVTETRILNRVLGAVLQENLLAMNLSTLIPEALKIGEYLQALLEESTRAFQDTQMQAHLVQSTRSGTTRRSRAKAG